MVSALIMSGCNTNTPAPTTTSTDQPSTQAHQETTATIAVVDADKNMMESTHSDDSMVMDDKDSEEPAPALEAGGAVYQEYTEARKIDLHGSKPYVLFFHANWCPICRVMETSITEGLASFPEGTTILKANYDTEKALKDEFGVRVQSTIIVLDADGEVVWKGQDPALDDLKQYITDSLS